MQEFSKAVYVNGKLAALCAALFCLLILPRSMLAQEWAPTLGISVDTQAGYLAKAYTSKKYGNGSGGAGGSSPKAKLKIRRAPIALTLRLRRVIALNPSGPFDLAISGAVKLSHVSLIYPNGIGVLVDPLGVTSQSLGLEFRGGAVIGRNPRFGSIEAGVGLHVLRTIDRFNYGTWRIVERRSDVVPLGYLRYVRKVVGKSSIFAEGLVSRHGTSVATGLEWNF